MRQQNANSEKSATSTQDRGYLMYHFDEIALDRVQFSPPMTGCEWLVLTQPAELNERVELAVLHGVSKSVIEHVCPLKHIPEREIIAQLFKSAQRVWSTKNDPSRPTKTGTNASKTEILNFIRFQYNLSFILQGIGVPSSADRTFSAKIWQKGLAVHKGMAASIDFSISVVFFNFSPTSTLVSTGVGIFGTPLKIIDRNFRFSMYFAKHRNVRSSPPKFELPMQQMPARANADTGCCGRAKSALRDLEILLREKIPSLPKMAT